MKSTQLFNITHGKWDLLIRNLFAYFAICTIQIEEKQKNNKLVTVTTRREIIKHQK